MGQLAVSSRQFSIPQHVSSAAFSAHFAFGRTVEWWKTWPQHPNAMTYGVVINPPPDTVLRKDDEIIVISLDDDTYQPRAQPALRGAVAREARRDDSVSRKEWAP